jgi:hypothetical protein
MKRHFLNLVKICGWSFDTRQMSGSPGFPRSRPSPSPSLIGWIRICSGLLATERSIQKRGVCYCLLDVQRWTDYWRQASPVKVAQVQARSLYSWLLRSSSESSVFLCFFFVFRHWSCIRKKHLASVDSDAIWQRWTLMRLRDPSFKEDHETIFSGFVSSVLGPQLKDVKLLETTAWDPNK